MEQDASGPASKPAPGAPQRSPAVRPFFSIVIPAHNEEGYLGPTLQALRQQSDADYEVIVVGNQCTDRTMEIARGFAHRAEHLPERGLSRARNLGARLAQGELLIFLDADTRLSPGALETIRRRFTPACAGGTLRGRPDQPRWRFRAMYFFKNWMHRLHLHPGSSGVILCWRKHFEQAGGFDESLHMRENSELIKRLLRWGSYCYIREASAVTSMRRYTHRGFWKTLFFWFRVGMRSRFGGLRGRHYDAVR